MASSNRRSIVVIDPGDPHTQINLPTRLVLLAIAADNVEPTLVTRLGTCRWAIRWNSRRRANRYRRITDQVILSTEVSVKNTHGKRVTRLMIRNLEI